MHAIRGYDRLDRSSQLSPDPARGTAPIFDRDRQRFEILRNGTVRGNRVPNGDRQRINRLTVQSDDLSHACSLTSTDMGHPKVWTIRGRSLSSRTGLQRSVDA